MLAALQKRNFDRVMKARADIALTTKAMTPQEVADLLGSRAKSPRALLQRKRKASELLAFPCCGEMVYPAIQFGVNGAVLPEVRRLLADGSRLGWPTHGDWSMMLWLCSSNGFLGGSKPADRLAIRPAAVVEAFISQFSEELDSASSKPYE